MILLHSIVNISSIAVMRLLSPRILVMVITADGLMVTYTYTAARTYTMQLTVSSATEQWTISMLVHVVKQPTSYNNPYAHYHASEHSRANPAVALPTPDNSLTDRASTAFFAKTQATTTSATTPASILAVGGI
jgi:PKD repeat protein